MKLRTIKAAFAKWGLEAFPPTSMTVMALAATLKKGGYRSAESYLLLYRAECERRGAPYPADLVRVHRDCLRSCLRGLGGPVKALSLPFERLGELDLEEDGPWSTGGPVGPAAAVVAGSWFLTREVELSTTRAALIDFVVTAGGDVAVQWKLPASKSDQQALGVARTHGCACGGGAVAGCPYHALKNQIARLRRLFPHMWSEAGCALDLPLFPDADGSAVTKEAMTATIVAAATRLDISTASVDGAERVSGHSLRRTGAQGFARLGIDAWAIQLLGRWGSQAVLEYIQEVPLERSAEWARRAASSAGRSSRLSEVASSSDGAALAHGQPSSSSTLPSASVGALASLAVEVGQLDAVEGTESGTSQFVRSTGLVWHRVPSHGTAGPTSTWTTSCGWRFAKSDAMLQPSLPERVLHKFLCKRCLPDQHRAAKEQC